MFNSIQQFETAGIKNLRKAEDEFINTFPKFGPSRAVASGSGIQPLQER